MPLLDAVDSLSELGAKKWAHDQRVCLLEILDLLVTLVVCPSCDVDMVPAPEESEPDSQFKLLVFLTHNRSPQLANPAAWQRLGHRQLQKRPQKPVRAQLSVW